MWRYALGMAERGAVLKKDPEWRRAAVKKFKKHKGAGAGSGATEALEAERSQGWGHEGLDRSSVESRD